MTTNDPSEERRAWRTEAEWLRLRERIAAELSPTDLATSEVRSGTSARRLLLRTLPRQAAIAAALVGVAVIGTVLVRRVVGSRDAVFSTRIVRTGIGERVVIRLSDSSTVMIGPTSTLRLALSAHRRDVALSGIAAFTVHHDAARPFVVRAGNAEASDLGTEFVVRAYTGDSAVMVAVGSGAVALRVRDGRSVGIALRAGSVGAVHADGTVSPGAGSDAAALTAWEHGGLAFDDAPLASVAAELERWFDVHVVVVDTALARRHVTAVYEDPSLTRVLDALALALDLRWERSMDGRSISLRRRSR